MPRPKGSGNRSEFVQYAIAGINAEIQQLQNQIDELTAKRKQFGKEDNVASVVVTAKAAKVAKAEDGEAPKKKRVVSAVTKKRLKEAAKARWARKRAEEAGQ